MKPKAKTELGFRNWTEREHELREEDEFIELFCIEGRNQELGAVVREVLKRTKQPRCSLRKQAIEI